MRIVFYSHGGSGNHGCEAIIRSTIKILNESGYAEVEKHIFSYAAAEDIKYCSDLPNTRIHSIEPIKKTLRYYLAAAKYKYLHDDDAMTNLRHKSLYDFVKKGDIAICVGGDTYTYDGWPELLAAVNKKFKSKGVKTVLWGCSLSEDLFKDKNALADMKTFDLITPREEQTAKLLIDNGVCPDNISLVADPAFNLDVQPCDLPEAFTAGKEVVGINMSPLSLSCGKSSNMVVENYINLIRYILRETDYNVALIPHVVWAGNDDREAMAQLYAKFKDDARVSCVSDANCSQLKYVISKCKCFIGARTHATIAAYSQLVPTLVIGYSLKAYGIARKLFGKNEGYVIGVQDIESPDEIVNGFKFILENYDDIKDTLRRVIPGYKRNSYAGMPKFKTLG